MPNILALLLLAVPIVIETGMGRIEAELDDQRAPATVANFLKYVDSGRYSGGRFHRTVTTKPDNQPQNAVKIDVIQAGVNPAVSSKDFAPIALERRSKTGLKHIDGALSMARSGPDSATSDFFICAGDQPELDFGGKRNPDGQGFAVFGRVTQGMDVVRRIQSAPANGQSLAPPVEIISIRRKRTVSDAEVMKVHRSALLIDGHNDVTSETVKGLDLRQPGKGTHTDIERLKRGGVGAQFFAAYVSAQFMKDNQSAHRALQMIDTIRHDIVDRSPDAFDFVTTSKGIRDARKRKRIAALIGIEGGHAIEDDPRLLRQFYNLGVRYMTLTHTADLSWAGSSGSKENRGLNDLGREVVSEMNRLGMLIDISHVSDKTFEDVMAASRAPVFASHSSCRALNPEPRNMTDDMLKAVAKKGGVVMINFYCYFLKPKEQGRATIGDVVAHINHVRDVAGIDAIGLGSDFDGIDCAPEGLEDVAQFPNLTRKLLEEGYGAAEIRKIYGGNFLRFMEAVEKASAGKRP